MFSSLETYKIEKIFLFLNINRWWEWLMRFYGQMSRQYTLSCLHLFVPRMHLIDYSDSLTLLQIRLVQFQVPCCCVSLWAIGKMMEHGCMKQMKQCNASTAHGGSPHKIFDPTQRLAIRTIRLLRLIESRRIENKPCFRKQSLNQGIENLHIM